MKKLLFLFIPLVFFFSCEPDDDNSNLDNNLFGAWKADIVVLNPATLMPEITEDWRIFNQDGTYQTSNNSADGEWWIDGGLLIMNSIVDENYLIEQQYDVVGDTLRFYTENPVLWIDKNGNVFAPSDFPPYYYNYLKQ
tara:strand:- start:44 stop:457 length:414 start_codon:yes stop_codon:yes gene_type:complete